MHMRLMFALLASLVFAVPAITFAEAGAQAKASGLEQIEPQALPACPQPGAKGLNVAQTIQTDCCKEHKGVCGCRAGKIVCCDGKPSTVTGCTCHGDDGFLE